MEKLKLHSPDFTQANIAKLAELFPNCVTEIKDELGKMKDEMGGENSSLSLQPSSLRYAIDFDLLKQELSTSIVEGPQERYQLNWPGKREALLTANAPIAKTLRPCREESVNFDTTQNLYIEGDNLDALKLLQETYLGKVKMIYIDPPYNTGNDFIYEDDFAENCEAYFERSNQKDEVGNRLVANNESNGRFHSDWLSMMYSRLKLARNLLQDDGVIFISIDDNEQANLKRLCDEVFGEDNFAGCFLWLLPRGINAGLIARAHEYILCYTKDSFGISHFNRLNSEIEYSVERCNKKIDERHPASPITFPAGIKYEGIDKTISGTIEGSERIEIDGDLVFSNGFLAQPVTLTAGWTMKNMILSWLAGNEIVDTKGQKIVDFFFKENGKLYSKKEMTTLSVKSVLKDLPDTQKARQEIQELLGNQDIFSYPKTKELLQVLGKLSTNENDIILDFFSGSATTAHAVMQLNAEDGGSRKFIMVQLPEVCPVTSEAYKAGYKTIAEIGKERIRRAGQKIKAELGRLKDEKGGENSSLNLQLSSLDTGFRVLKVDNSNMKDVYYTPDKLMQGDLDQFTDNIRDDSTPEDLLFQVLLDWGVDLTLPITMERMSGKDEGGRLKDGQKAELGWLKDEKGGGNSSSSLHPSSFRKEFQVFFVDDNALAACFDEDITEAFVKELAARHPMRVVFRDAGFASDSVKINIEQIFKLISPTTEIKTL